MAAMSAIRDRLCAHEAGKVCEWSGQVGYLVQQIMADGLFLGRCGPSCVENGHLAHHADDSAPQREPYSVYKEQHTVVRFQIEDYASR